MRRRLVVPVIVAFVLSPAPGRISAQVAAVLSRLVTPETAAAWVAYSHVAPLKRLQVEADWHLAFRAVMPWKEYLDLTAGYFVNNAGHCHPHIVEAATTQMHDVLQVSGKHGTVAEGGVVANRRLPLAVETGVFPRGRRSRLLPRHLPSTPSARASDVQSLSRAGPRP